MIQLFLLTVSFTYGLAIGMIYYLILRKILKTENIHIIFNTLFFIIATLIYIAIFYYLNNGDIHLYLKLVLIIGFILSFKVSNLSKSYKKSIIQTLLKKIR